jgi:hypothetical protein
MHSEQLIHRLVVGDGAAIAAIVESSRTSDDPMILVAAALFAPDSTAHLRGEPELVDALARDHLVDHPDNVLVAWIAGASHSTKELS